MKAAALAGAFAGAPANVPAAQAEAKFIAIGAGGQTGVCFAVGQSICRLVNRGAAEHGLKRLAVMASHAPDTVREFLAGSQAGRIVRRAPASVPVVPAQGRATRKRRLGPVRSFDNRELRPL